MTQGKRRCLVQKIRKLPCISPTVSSVRSSKTIQLSKDLIVYENQKEVYYSILKTSMKKTVFGKENALYSITELRLINQQKKGSYDQCYACRAPITEADKQLPHYQAGIICHQCYLATSETQKKRYQQRQKQQVLAKKSGRSHIGPQNRT